MKPETTFENYPSKVKEYTNYCTREIKHVCKNIDKRGSGSQGETDAQNYFAKHLEEVADDVKVEPFSVNPGAFFGWISIAAISVIAAAFMYNFWMPIIATFVVFFGVLCIVLEFLMYKKFIDPFFRKKESRNVVARRTPTDTVKRRIIFSGHTDAAHEWTYNQLGGSKLLIVAVVCSIGALLLTFALCLLSVLAGNVTSMPETGFFRIVGYILFAFIVPAVLIFFFNNRKLVVDGANDNLTGVVGSMAVLRMLHDSDIQFKHTEVVALLTGCEEVGLRGAKFFAKEHEEELLDPNVETVFIGLETLRDYDHMAIYARDMTGTVQNDLRVCNLVKEGAKRAGRDLPFESVFFGASDAAAVSQAGIPATTLAGMDPAPARYYHTRRDTADNLDKRTIQLGLDISMQSLFLFDKEGLKENYSS